MNDKSLLNGDSVLLTNIKNWNVRFPFDLTWRRKYNVPFCSTEHKQMCLFDIKFDVEESRLIDKIIIETINENNNKDLGENNKQLLKSKITKRLSKEELDQAFEDLDLDSFDGIKV